MRMIHNIRWGPLGIRAGGSCWFSIDQNQRLFQCWPNEFWCNTKCDGSPDGAFSVSPNGLDNWCQTQPHQKSERQSTQSVIVDGIVDCRLQTMYAEGRWWSVTFVLVSSRRRGKKIKPKRIEYDAQIYWSCFVIKRIIKKHAESRESSQVKHLLRVSHLFRS